MNRVTAFKIIGILILLISIVAVVYSVLDNTEPVDTNPQTDNTLPIGGDVENQLHTKISEILSRSETTDVGSGTYIISGGNSLTDIPPYQIVYYAPDQSYVISLLATPLAKTRLSAEQAFLTLLNVSSEDVCSLSVMVTTPFDVSEEYSGKNLGFSFCPGSITLK